MLVRLARIANKRLTRFTSISNSVKMVELGGNLYPLSKAERVYKKLTFPMNSGVFYQDNRVIGTIETDGEVRFYTQWDELKTDDNPLGWSLLSPTELGIQQISDTPDGSVRRMIRALNNLLTYKDGTIKSSGSGLYYNIPLSSDRAGFYQRKARFVNANLPEGKGRFQIRNNRRFTASPTIAELLILGDAGHLKNLVAAEVLREELLRRHSQLREIVEQKIAAVTGFGPPDIPADEVQFDYYPTLMERKVKLLQNILSFLGK